MIEIFMAFVLFIAIQLFLYVVVNWIFTKLDSKWW